MSSQVSSIDRSMRFAELLPPAAQLHGDANAIISGISSDSRLVNKGDLFVAKTGIQQHGSRYIPDARARGATAVVTDDEQLGWHDGDLPTAYIPNLEQAVSFIADDFYDHPSQKLAVTGVTGTNGKTSCCVWYAWMSNQLGQSCGEIGTLGAGLKRDDEALPSTGMTTPDAVKVQSLLAEIRDAGADALVMEVSSHGLDQGRVEAVQFETAIFTNFTQDHLDYHGDMDAYFAAKASLFQRSELQRAVLNRDDSTFDRLAASLSADTEIYSYSLSQSVADLFVANRTWVKGGAQVQLSGRWGNADVLIPVIGDYNLANLLAVSTALLSSGFEFAKVVETLARVPAVPGRMQSVSKLNCPQVIVDYAHTPDAVTNALKVVRKQAEGSLITVLGCGGDRDADKRPLMGLAAAELADKCWFTSDNPRSEDPEAIVADMMKSVSSQNIQIDLDRASAIRSAIESAESSDFVLILGKGHEDYQEIAAVRQPFDDVAQAEQVLAGMSVQRGAE